MPPAGVTFSTNLAQLFPITTAFKIDGALRRPEHEEVRKGFPVSQGHLKNVVKSSSFLYYHKCAERFRIAVRILAVLEEYFLSHGSHCYRIVQGGYSLHDLATSLTASLPVDPMDSFSRRVDVIFQTLLCYHERIIRWFTTPRHLLHDLSMQAFFNRAGLENVRS